MIISYAHTYVFVFSRSFYFVRPSSLKKKLFANARVTLVSVLVGYANSMIFLALLFGSCLLSLTAYYNSNYDSNNSGDANATNAGFQDAVSGSCCLELTPFGAACAI